MVRSGQGEKLEEKGKGGRGVTQQEAEPSHVGPGAARAPHPPGQNARLGPYLDPGRWYTWLRPRVWEGDARPLTTCPPPAPALGLTSLRGEEEEGAIGRPAAHLGRQPAPAADTAWGPSAAGG